MNITVKGKEIRINNPRIVIEDEHRAEVVEFAIQHASSIQGLSGMAFYVQYRNKVGEVGMDSTETTYAEAEDTLHISWLPSASFSKERGVVEIQIVGFTQSLVQTEDTEYQAGKMYFTEEGEFLPVYPADSQNSPKVGDEITDTVYENEVTGNDHRWSTEKAILLLPENIVDGGTPVYTKAQVQNLITQLNLQVLQGGTYASLSRQYAEGKKSDGTDVVNGEAGYQDNAKFFKDLAKNWAIKVPGTVEGAELSAKGYALVAEQRSQEAEVYALGTKNGIPQPAFADKNAKHFAEEADASASAAAQSASDANADATVAYDAAVAAESAKSDAETARDRAKDWANKAEDVEVAEGEYSAKHYAAKASASATSADNSATDAGTAKTDAEAARNKAQEWAEKDTEVETGKHSAKYHAEGAEDNASLSRQYAEGKHLDGTDVTSDEPGYNNNAKYYAEQAALQNVGWAWVLQSNGDYKLGLLEQ